MDQNKVAIEIKNVSKTFVLNKYKSETFKQLIVNLFKPSKKEIVRALNSVNLTIYKGETFGIIGRNGSGKSTLTKIMSGTYIPDKGGIVKKYGKSMLLSLRVGMSPELTARQNIYVSGSILGLTLKEIDRIFDDIISFAELERFVDTKIRHFSNGMIQRLSFATAINAGADIMFLDEVFAVGDKKFRDRATELMEKNWLNERTVVLVSHSMGNLKKYCDRVLYLKNGQIEYLGDPKTAIEMYNKDNS